MKAYRAIRRARERAQPVAPEPKKQAPKRKAASKRKSPAKARTTTKKATKSE